MRHITLKDGATIPVIGQGTWSIGDDPARRAEEIAALRLGIDLGMTLIDTAEMYGSGAAEEVVGEAIRGRRDQVFLVTKVLPQNASRRQIPKSIDASLKRLGTDYVDLYLLHWESEHPIGETIDAFVKLKDQGKIRRYGVSNFDARALAAGIACPGGEA